MLGRSMYRQLNFFFERFPTESPEPGSFNRNRATSVFASLNFNTHSIFQVDFQFGLFITKAYALGAILCRRYHPVRMKAIYNNLTNV